MRDAKTNKKPVLVEYHVYDNYIKEVANTPVIKNNGRRTVRLSPAAAQYLMDAGSIGLIPVDELSDDAKKALGQMHKTAM